ncbi:MAG: prepilin-type N-terminal cleavage/methylation domain-containing protein [Verrucomicrobiota bacterium]
MVPETENAWSPSRPQTWQPAGGRPERQAGLTLIELLVVLVILVGLGGLTLALINNGATLTGADGVTRTDNQIVTEETLQTVRDVLIGTSSSDLGYYQHLGQFPESLGALLTNIDNEPIYNPATKRGWRGPYLATGGGRYGNFLDASDQFPDNSEISGIEDDPVILDSWGKPLLLGQESGSDFAWLISAGPDRELDTDLDTALDSDRDDDLVLFLLTTDPNLQ